MNAKANFEAAYEIAPESKFVKKCIESLLPVATPAAQIRVLLPVLSKSPKAKQENGNKSVKTRKHAKPMVGQTKPGSKRKAQKSHSLDASQQKITKYFKVKQHDALSAHQPANASRKPVYKLPATQAKKTTQQRKKIKPPADMNF